MREEFLYQFGYESPGDYRANLATGADAEALGAFRIRAASEDEALRWGRTLSRWYIERLFDDESGPGWDQNDYASWIERAPDESLPQFREPFGPVDCGEYPEFDLVRDAFRD